MTPTIRLATAKDADQIAQVHTQSWRETYRGIVADSYLNAIDVDEKSKWWTKALSQSALVHVVETDRIVGFATGGKISEKNQSYEGELYALYLLKEYQGKGMGKMLLGAILNQLISQSINSMLVWVLKDNPSKNFYLKQGGILIEEKEIEIGGQNLIEEAYGWSDICTE